MRADAEGLAAAPPKEEAMRSRARRAGVPGRLRWLAALGAVLASVAVGSGVSAQSQLPRGEPGLPSPGPLQSGAAQAGSPPLGTGRGVVTGGNPPPAFDGRLPGAPAVSPPLPVVAGVVPWDLLGQVRTVRVKDRFVPEFPPTVSRLNRQNVKVVGFMLPLQAGEKQSHFLLTVTSQTCAFCLPVGPEGIVEVRTRTPVRVTFDALVVAGRFEVLPDDPLGVYYRISNGESVPIR